MEIKPIELAEGLEFAAEVQGGTLITIRRDGRPQSSDVHHAVDLASVCAAYVDDVGIEDFAVFLIEIHPFLDRGFSFVRIVQARPTIARLRARAEQAGHQRFVDVEVFR